MRIGVALDQRTEFSRARLRLTQIEQGVSLLQLGRGQLVACRIAVQAFVIFIDRFGVVFLSVVGLPYVELGVRSQLRVGIVLEVLLEVLDGEVVPARIVIGSPGLVQSGGIRDARSCVLGRRRARSGRGPWR